MSGFPSDVAFTPSVKDIQSRRGSRKIYEKIEARGGFQTKITEDLAAFLASIDTAYLSTASAGGQPYAQHRGIHPRHQRAYNRLRRLRGQPAIHNNRQPR